MFFSDKKSNKHTAGEAAQLSPAGKLICTLTKTNILINFPNTQRKANLRTCNLVIHVTFRSNEKENKWPPNYNLYIQN